MARKPSKADNDAPDVITIKKYANRRLYNRKALTSPSMMLNPAMTSHARSSPRLLWSRNPRATICSPRAFSAS
jgi:hypothetical protein